MTTEPEEVGEKLPYYPWYPRDFLADTLLLTETEELMYRRLLDYQWLQGSVPDALGEVAAAARMTRTKAAQAWKRVAAYFPFSEDGARRNRRMERDSQDLRQQRRRRQQAGANGGAATWGDAPRFVYAMQRASDGAIKVGWSRNPSARAVALSSQLGSEMSLLATTVGGPKLERQAQVDLAPYRIGTEWFAPHESVRQWVAENIGTALVHQPHTAGAPRCTASIPEPEPEPEKQQLTDAARASWTAERLRGHLPESSWHDLDAVLVGSAQGRDAAIRAIAAMSGLDPMGIPAGPGMRTCSVDEMAAVLSRIASSERPRWHQSLANRCLDSLRRDAQAEATTDSRSKGERARDWANGLA